VAVPPSPARHLDRGGRRRGLERRGHSAVPLPANLRWVLVGSLAVAVASVPALIRTLKVREVLPALYRTATLTLVGCAVAIAAVGTASWGADGTLAAMVLVLGIPIAVGL
jgi:hypothetical protein